MPDNVLGEERVSHPDVLAVLQRLVLVPCCRDGMEPVLPERRQQNILDEFILAALAEVGGQVIAPLDLGCRERSVGFATRTDTLSVPTCRR